MFKFFDINGEEVMVVQNSQEVRNYRYVMKASGINTSKYAVKQYDSDGILKWKFKREFPLDEF